MNERRKKNPNAIPSYLTRSWSNELYWRWNSLLWSTITQNQHKYRVPKFVIADKEQQQQKNEKKEANDFPCQLIKGYLLS